MSGFPFLNNSPKWGASQANKPAFNGLSVLGSYLMFPNSNVMQSLLLRVLFMTGLPLARICGFVHAMSMNLPPGAGLPDVLSHYPTSPIVLPPQQASVPSGAPYAC
jgi:hypothetical protein